MIDLTVDETALEAVAAHTRDRRVRIPTLAQMQDPGLIPSDVQAGLVDIGLWDLHPLNLYRITWHNEPVAHGGGFGGVNYVEWPSALPGTDARIVSLIGKWFPTGAHKVGAASGAWFPAWLPASSTRPPRRRCGRPPGTTAGAVPTTPTCWVASRWPSSRRG